MKNKFYPFIALLSFLFFLSISGCKKETTTPIETIPTDLFPLKAGNTWHYSGYEIDRAGEKIAGTEFTSSTTVVGQIQFEGKNPFVAIDSFKYQTETESDTLLIYLEGNYLYAWIDLTSTLGIPGLEFKRWAPFIKTGGNLNEPYTILNLDTTVLVNYQDGQIPQNIRVNITGNIIAKEEIQVPAGKFVSYKFEAIVTGSAKVGGVVVGSFSSKNYIWFSPGIGPIKHEILATSLSNGTRRELVSYHLR